MERAWKNVKANRGAPGPDGITLKQFPEHFRSPCGLNYEQTTPGWHVPTASGSAQSHPETGWRRAVVGHSQHYRAPDSASHPASSHADLRSGFLRVEFRLSTKAFRTWSRQASPTRYIKQGYRFVVDMDLSKFFDRVQHDVLMSRVARKVHDKRMLKLIGRYLRAGVMVNGLVQPSLEGTMQGGPLSPLLANVLLDDLDKELESYGACVFARYADDFQIYVKTHRSARRVFASVERFLTRKLKLVVNQQKSRIAKTDGVEFLGFKFVGRRGEIRVTAKNLTKFKQRVRSITGRSRGISMRRMLGELRQYLRGWIGYFGLAATKGIFAALDEWIRRRVRMCFWKQWRLPRTRIRKLKQLGVPHDVAVPHGTSRKAYWRLAKTLGGHMGMTKTVAVRSRTCVSQISLERACSSAANRRMRTRTYGGVGAGRGNPSGYLIWMPYQLEHFSIW